MASARRPEERFSTRVENYIRYRPTYPEEVLVMLEEACDAPTLRVADIGSGTGIFSELLLKRGHRVDAVEPNQSMREAAESTLGHSPEFASHATSAEATGLDSGVIDLITAAQAFHWFDTTHCRSEFERILKPDGILALIWNERQSGEDSSPFLRAYEALLQKFGTHYTATNHRSINPSAIERFFAPAICRMEAFNNFQEFDLEGITGRLLSSSYVPDATDPAAVPMLSHLEEIVSEHAIDGRIRIEYETRVYVGKLSN